MGSQDIEVCIEEIYSFIKSFNKVPLKIEDYLFKPYSRLSTGYIYASIGVNKYDCIDIDGVHNSLCFDLNYNLSLKYSFNHKYDIVTNFGTTEHIFNQFSCFENIHNLCTEGGLMIHSLPINGYSNHCFFNYHSTFFEHLAKSNNYEILYMDYIYKDYYQNDGSEGIFVIFKKIDNNIFSIPIQKSTNDLKKSINKLDKNLLKARFKTITNTNLDEIHNIAIFGTQEAGDMAYSFASGINKKVLCFIDDYKNGYFKNTMIPIISYEIFIDKYQSKVDLILQGNKQKGALHKRNNLKKKVIELSNLLCES